MARHWQKKPLLIRNAVPDMPGLVQRDGLFALAANDNVQSRLVVREGARWTLRHGPLARRALPALRQPGWSLLVQGVDLFVPALHALLQRFRFVPDARLDDMMVSYASDGGGVGAHFDSYDVFLLQAQGRRRWRIGRVEDRSLLPDAPLRILANFQAQEEHLLEPGDMLYLPPGYAHEGQAVGACLTCSIGFRAPRRSELAGELLQRLADLAQEQPGSDLYSDPGQGATAHPAQLPPLLLAFAERALRRVTSEPQALARSLGCWLTEPKPGVWFEALAAQAKLPRRGARGVGASLVLDAKTRMLYHRSHVFINGESHRAAGPDAVLMRRLADDRGLGAERMARASVAARLLLDEWKQAGWLHAR
jgi:50S ribosomal protein L16 3-hydroxylase